MNTNKYYMLLVSSNEDIFLISEKSCFTCFQIKKDLTILKNFGLIQHNEVIIMIKDYKMKSPINIICNCKN